MKDRWKDHTLEDTYARLENGIVKVYDIKTGELIKSYPWL